MTPGHMAGDYSDRPVALRSLLVAETNGEYPRFVGGLGPRYILVWRDIALAYAALLAAAWLVQLPESAALRIAAIAPGAVAIGAALAFLQLFLHEAAHCNLAGNRPLNDWLCDALIGWPRRLPVTGPSISPTIAISARCEIRKGPTSTR